MSDWLDAVLASRQRDESGVLVTVVETKGSTPRETGTKMWVTQQGCYNTIGGGNLEYKAIEIAREILSSGRYSSSLRRFPLGPSLGQCCGGVAVLLFEPLVVNDFSIVLFGAGHVGKALVQVLQGLPCRITWVDSREEQFPDVLPANVTIVQSDAPDCEVDAAPPDSYFLIMTHSHPLDQAICERVLRRDDVRYCGLIGSASKLRKFKKRMLARDLPAAAFDGLTCPIGVGGISGKHPSEIAIAVAAQLLQVRQCHEAEQGDSTSDPVSVRALDT